MSDLREKAEALLNFIDEEHRKQNNGAIILNINSSKEYKDLKAALRPSREEIADYLEDLNKAHTEGGNFSKEESKYVQYCIEELRK